MRLSQSKIPTLKNGEVLIEVYSAGVNRPDILQRSGQYLRH
nr:hypothetical protein [Candidatus Profftella armatura (Diaphorina cf. continua)]